jgi:hypothetical protein
MSNKRQRRRIRDWFKKPTFPPEDPSYDFGGEDPEPEEGTPEKSRWEKRREERRRYVIERKKAQAGIAKHRKWVLMWVAVIVVAVVILALAIMNKLSITGLIF